MKSLSVILLLIPAIFHSKSKPYATRNFYFASAAHGGSDGNTGTIGSPYLTLAKVAGAGPVAGDTFYFHAGDTIPGIATVNGSGAAGNPIVFATYSTGANAVLGGMYDLGPWTSLGGNKYEALYTGTIPNNRVVVVNGVQYHVARSPNTGFRTFTGSTSTYIIDPSYSGPSATGSGIVIRSSYFTEDRGTITTQSVDTFKLGFTQSYTNNGGNGYFFTNEASYLDTVQEYYQNGDSIEIYSLVNPSTIPVYTSQYDTTIQASTRAYLTFIGLNFIGSNDYAIYFNDVTNVVVQNCTFQWHGLDAFFTQASNFTTISGSTFENILNNAITVGETSSYLTIINNYIAQVGAIQGMGNSGSQSYEGIDEAQIDAYIAYNTIDTVGFNPIYFGSLDSAVVKYNTINYHNFILIDGGGIYTFSASTPTITHYAQVDSNVVMNGMGFLAYPGTTATGVESTSASGGYLDGHECCQVWRHNTFINESANGMYVHGTKDTIEYNNSFGNSFANYQWAEASGGVVLTGLYAKYNYSGNTSSTPAFYWYTPNNDLSSFGICDSNYVGGPVGSSTLWYTKSSVDVGTYRTLAGFQANQTGYDQHTTFQTGSLSIAYALGTATNNYLNGLCTSLTTLPRFYGSTIVPAYSSTIMKVIPGGPMRVGNIQSMTQP